MRCWIAYRISGVVSQPLVTELCQKAMSSVCCMLGPCMVESVELGTLKLEQPKRNGQTTFLFELD